MNRRASSWTRGSFTVEMTMLMVVMLPMLIALMLAAFYVHDRSCMQSEACELAALGSCMAVYEDRDGRISKRAGELSSGRLSWSNGITASASAGTKSGSGQLSGQFEVPGLAAQLWNGGTANLSESWTYRITRPAPLIRKMRGARDALGRILP